MTRKFRDDTFIENAVISQNSLFPAVTARIYAFVYGDLTFLLLIVVRSVALSYGIESKHLGRDSSSNSFILTERPLRYLILI